MIDQRPDGLIRVDGFGFRLIALGQRHEVERGERVDAFRTMAVGEGAGDDAGAQIGTFFIPRFDGEIGLPLGELAGGQLAEQPIDIVATERQC